MNRSTFLPVFALVLAVEGAHLHLYGKSPTERRKVGHVRLVLDSAEALSRGVTALKQVLVADGRA